MRKINTMALLVLAAVGPAIAGCGAAMDAVRGMFGPSPTELVAMAFDPSDPDRRREGISMLADHSWGLDETYCKRYVQLLNDEDDGVRSAAVLALGKTGDPKYLPPIIAMLEDRIAMVRWDAAVALDNVHGPAAIGPLQSHATADSNADVRAACAKALGYYRDNKEVLQTLIACLDDYQFGVRYSAHASLVALTGRDLGYDVSRWTDMMAGRLPPPQPERGSRPWWDWFGITKPEPAPAPATQPAEATQ